MYNSDTLNSDKLARARHQEATFCLPSNTMPMAYGQHAHIYFTAWTIILAAERNIYEILESRREEFIDKLNAGLTSMELIEERLKK